MPLSNFDDDNHDGKDDGGLKRADSQYLVVHDCIHKYRHTVLGQDLKEEILNPQGRQNPKSGFFFIRSLFA